MGATIGWFGFGVTNKESGAGVCPGEQAVREQSTLPEYQMDLVRTCHCTW
jgi:hypothetical protein